MNTALLNARVYTQDRAAPTGEAVLIGNDRVLRIGRTEEVLAVLGGNGEVFDLGGRALFPGFIDTHVHLLELGFALSEVSLESARTMNEVLGLLGAALEAGVAPVEGRGLDPPALKELRYPSPEELDGLSRDVPVLVRRRDCHSAVLNTAAWKLVGGSERVPPVLAGPDFQRALGRWVRRRTPQQRREAYRRAGGHVLQAGVTTVHALVGSDQDPSNRDGELLLEESSQLPVDVVPYLQVRDVRRVKELGLNRVGGCLLLDGSIGSHTAALADPFADDPGNRGLLYFRDEILQEFISSANEAAMQTAVHAIGDRALEQILRVHERCASPASSRHRVEHAELPGPSQIDRALALGLLFGMQPAFEHFWGGPEGMYRQHLGPERASRTNPLRTLAERGMPIAGGSDAPITPVSPMLGIHAAVNHPAECERLELSAAVEMFTTNGAYFSFDEAWKGKLAPGYRADLVLLDQDPFWVPASRLKDVAVLAVWSRGVLRFDRGGLWKQTQG